MVSLVGQSQLLLLLHLQPVPVSACFEPVPHLRHPHFVLSMLDPSSEQHLFDFAEHYLIEGRDAPLDFLLVGFDCPLQQHLAGMHRLLL